MARDETYAADAEYVIPHYGSKAGSFSHSCVATLGEWLSGMRDPYGSPRPIEDIRPPTYWVDLQDELGRGAAKWNIWRMRYSRDKKLVTWASAPLRDFIAVGYARNRETLR